MYSAVYSNIVPLVKSMVSSVQSLAQSKNISVLFTALKDECKVNHQPEAVGKSLLSVLCRIIDHLPKRLIISVSVIENDDAVIIKIENSAINLGRISQITTDSILPVRIDDGERGRTIYYFDIAQMQSDIDEPVETLVEKRKATINVPAFYAEIRKRLQSHSNSAEKMLLLTKVHNPADAAFLQKINELIFANIADELFDANQLAEKMFLSRAQVFRRLKLITGKAPAGYIKSLRLQQAKKMLETMDVLVSEVAFATGFESVSHFTKVFSRRYGFTPSLLKRKPLATNEQKDAT